MKKKYLLSLDSCLLWIMNLCTRKKITLFYNHSNTHDKLILFDFLAEVLEIRILWKPENIFQEVHDWLAKMWRMYKLAPEELCGLVIYFDIFSYSVLNVIVAHFSSITLIYKTSEKEKCNKVHKNNTKRRYIIPRLNRTLPWECFLKPSLWVWAGLGWGRDHSANGRNWSFLGSLTRRTPCISVRHTPATLGGPQLTILSFVFRLTQLQK